MLQARDPDPRGYLSKRTALLGSCTDTVAATRYTGHIRRIGEEKAAAAQRDPRHKPRRWVVERTLAWLSKCRAILVRYDKHDVNYLGLLQLACSLFWYRRLHRLGAT